MNYVAGKAMKVSAIAPGDAESDVIPCGLVMQLHEHIDQWTKLWVDEKRRHPDLWDGIDLGASLKPIGVEELSEVCCTYRDGAGLGLDVFNPKLMLSLDRGYMQRGVVLMHKFEEDAVLPLAWSNLVIFHAKRAEAPDL